jgi:predicted DNA-binding transcriptional regulator AlpA
MESEPDLLDTLAVARRLGVSVKHLRRLVDRDEFPPPVRLGKCCRWPRHVIDDWIHSPYATRNAEGSAHE